MENFIEYLKRIGNKFNVYSIPNRPSKESVLALLEMINRDCKFGLEIKDDDNKILNSRNKK